MPRFHVCHSDCADDRHRSPSHVYDPVRYLRNKYAHRNEQMKRVFGITIEDYEQILDSQGGVCATCGALPPKSRRLSIDHDHKTGKIRGLLCHTCNTMLGVLESPRRQRLEAYLLVRSSA